MKTSFLLILGGHVECVKPNLSMSSCSDVRQQDESVRDSVKDPEPVELCSNNVYKFISASCNSCYVGETSRHLSTRICEHLNRDRTSHIFQHLQQSEACRNSCSAECFKVIDHATTKFQVKVKEALHISSEQPSLNKQSYHVNSTLSV